MEIKKIKISQIEDMGNNEIFIHGGDLCTPSKYIFHQKLWLNHHLPEIGEIIKIEISDHQFIKRAYY